jgi:hypothetical protein
MVGTRTKTARGLVVLALAGAVAGAALAGPVTAAAPAATKKFVKKQIKKVQGQVNALSSNVIHQPVYYRRSEQVVVPGAGYEEAFVACPAGTSALGGGVAPQIFEGPPSNYFGGEVEASHPSTGTGINAGTTGWSVGIEGAGIAFRAYVICAAVQKDSNFAENVIPARQTVGARE